MKVERVPCITAYGWLAYSQSFNKNIEYVSEEEQREIESDFDEILQREEEKLKNGARENI